MSDGTSESHGNVYARIARASEIISGMRFEKNKYVSITSRSGYAIMPIAQILEAVRKAHGEAGVVVAFGRPEFDEDKGEFCKRESAGWSWAVGHIDVRIFGEDENDCLEITVPCEARDNADKLTNKLITNGMRTLYRTLYSIDGDDAVDPEEINEAGAARVEQNRSNAVESARSDRFFGKPTSKTDEPSRSEEQTRDLVEKWSHLDFEAEGIMGTFRNRYGEDISKWGSEPLGECYNALLEHCRKRNSGASA